MSYAFRVFAAIYNHPVVDADSGQADICCFYGSTPPRNGNSRAFRLPARYRDIPIQNGSRNLTKHCYSGEDFHLAFGVDAASGQPDWLAEIFLWLSSSYELDIVPRDSVGRIPYSEMIFSHAGISPRKPYAALLMAWMENLLCHGNGEEALPRAPSPVSSIEHIIISSHDIDFYSVGQTSSFARLIKNLGIAVRFYGSWSYFTDNLKMMLQLLNGGRVGDYLPSLMEMEAQCGFRSTFFAVSRRGHRRDPNYRLEQIAPHLLNAAGKGFSVGVHGSYCSIIEDGTLPTETLALNSRLGGKSLANRQHWLRFGRHEDLFSEIERAGLACDSTLGFSDMVGFRNGASFAFPPYDFANERPHRFLEVPLVLMDGSLEAASRSSKESPQQLADEVLGESRKQGWGGIAVLWHNPIEPLNVPAEINRVFWSCAQRQQEFREKWMSLDQFLSCSVARYQQAGLLDGVRVDG
jgi:hypothetical protein